MGLYSLLMSHIGKEKNKRDGSGFSGYSARVLHVRGHVYPEEEPNDSRLPDMCCLKFGYFYLHKV